MKRIVITSIMAVCMLAAGSLPTFAVESNVQTEEQGITQNIEIPEDSLPDVFVKDKANMFALFFREIF